MWSVYILRCRDGSLYTGIAKDVRKRFRDHAAGKGGRYTRSHKPEQVVYVEACTTRSEALRREIEIKKLKRKDKVKLLKLHH